MSRTEDIDNAIWSDPDFLALTPEARLTYIWSWTNSRCGMAGLYKVALAQASLETGYDVETLERVFAELRHARFAVYEDHVLFVRARVKRLRTKTPQIAKSIRSDVQKIADGHPVKEAWIAEYGQAAWLLKALDGEAQWSLDRASAEGVDFGPLGRISGGSSEAQPSLKGKGKGKGSGKGPLGRGVGRESEHDRMKRWARENFPTIPDLEVLLIASHVSQAGEQVTVEAVAARLAEYHPELQGEAA